MIGFFFPSEFLFYALRKPVAYLSPTLREPDANLTHESSQNDIYFVLQTDKRRARRP
jgi:hypothetical protein